jgi:hypothetical protein
MSITPNLFIIGAMKAGTTSFHNMLNQHPEISMSTIKEPVYFAKKHLKVILINGISTFSTTKKYIT